MEERPIQVRREVLRPKMGRGTKVRKAKGMSHIGLERIGTDALYETLMGGRL